MGSVRGGGSAWDAPKKPEIPADSEQRANVTMARGNSRMRLAVTFAGVCATIFLPARLDNMTMRDLATSTVHNGRTPAACDSDRGCAPRAP
jgi:hypothetical protein